MLSTKPSLDLCYSLYIKGYRPEIYPGAVIARGFADLGYEEFSVLPNNRIVSLMTGEISETSHDDLGHFFLVPTVDECLNEIHKIGIDIVFVDYRDQRDWVIRCRVGHSGPNHEIEERHFERAVLQVLALGYDGLRK